MDDPERIDQALTDLEAIYKPLMKEGQEFDLRKHFTGQMFS